MEINSETREGKLLTAAVFLLRVYGPDKMKGQDAETILAELEKAADRLEQGTVQ